eukprot:7386396-Prymnesium_polylepis.1
MSQGKERAAPAAPLPVPVMLAATPPCPAIDLTVPAPLVAVPVEQQGGSSKGKRKQGAACAEPGGAGAVMEVRAQMYQD